jgi:hypothetical protein
MYPAGAKWHVRIVSNFQSFFLKQRQKKFCPNLLIKKKRIAQLIYEKPNGNQYKHTNTQRDNTPHLHRPLVELSQLPLTLEQSNEAPIRTPNAYYGSPLLLNKAMKPL